MTWIKHVIVDILMVAVIALATLADVTAARWAVIIYTPLMLVLKVVALLGGSAIGQFKQSKDAPPPWFFHLVYIVSILLLALNTWWIMAAGWVAIWILSLLAEHRTEMSRRAKTRVR